LKLPGLAGEVIVVAVLWRWASPRAAAAYACVPAAVLVSAYHGNTDTLMAAFVLCAAVAYDRQRYFLAGLLFACALDVKLVPLLLLPLLVIAAPSLRSLGRLLAGCALGLLPFVPPALAAAPAMYRNMVDYNSSPDSWGLLSFLNLAVEQAPIAGLSHAVRDWYIDDGRYVIALAVLALALLSRRRWHLPMTGQVAVGAALFLILAPGFGVQYVAFVTPVLCFVDLGAGIRWGVAAGVFVASVYTTFVVSWNPVRSVFWSPFPAPTPVLGVIAWAVLLHFVLSYLFAGETASRTRRHLAPSVLLEPSYGPRSRSN
jgi:hypothetical protein